VDVGTSSVRVSAVALDGEILAAVRRPAAARHEGDRAELDAAELARDVKQLIRALGASTTGMPLGIGIACQLGLVLVDEALRPVRPAMLWSDRRAVADVERLTRRLGGRAREVAGRPVAVEHTAPRLAWVAHHDPAAWQATSWVLGLKDFLIASLTGVVVTDPASASYSMLFDVLRGEWSRELAGAVDVPLERLPPVRSGAAVAGRLNAPVAEELGFPVAVPVAVGGPDGTVAVVGSGNASPGTTIDVAGSTDVVLHVLDGPLLDPHAASILNAFVVPGRWTIGGPTGLTGGAVGWLARILGHGSVEELLAEAGSAAAALDPGADGVTFHTALGGERFPRWDSAQAGAISGMRAHHGPAHLLRAADEGAAFAVREGIESLRRLGLIVDLVQVVGGAGRTAGSRQLRADAWGVPVAAAANAEATTTGAAILAAVAVGAFGDIDRAGAAMTRPTFRVEPDPAAAEPWERAFRRWQDRRITTRAQDV
jgi:sugar (pentulose or hexulose) kinase